MVGYRLCRKMLPLACRSAIFFARSDNIDRNGGKKHLFVSHDFNYYTMQKKHLRNRKTSKGFHAVAPFPFHRLFS